MFCPCFQTSGSQTTTDIESLTASPQRPVINAVTLQALGSVISKSLQEEEESLGKVWFIIISY